MVGSGVLDERRFGASHRAGCGFRAIDDDGLDESRSVSRDGTRDGFDLALTRAVVDAVTIPVIASGGVGTLQHLAAGVLEGGANAVLAASIFHFGEFTIDQAKRHMALQGIEVNR